MNYFEKKFHNFSISDQRHLISYHKIYLKRKTTIEQKKKQYEDMVDEYGLAAIQISVEGYTSFHEKNINDRSIIDWIDKIFTSSAGFFRWYEYSNEKKKCVSIH